jgi:hypothetical protein
MWNSSGFRGTEEGIFMIQVGDHPRKSEVFEFLFYFIYT